MKTTNPWLKPVTDDAGTLTTQQETGEIQLHQLVDKLVNNLSPVAVRNNTVIVNEASRQLAIVADEQLMASVVSGLIYSVISNAKDSNIRITAKEMYGVNAVIAVHDS